jgi:hypothetical protein
MAGDTYFRARRRKQFTTISNACLRDTKLSIEAVGFLAVMTSMSPDWVLNKTWLRKRFDIGREKLDRIIRELKVAGYAVITQDRDQKTGRMGQVTYVFSDEANQFDEEDEPGQSDGGKSPLTEKPYTGEPVSGKPAPKKDYKARNTNSKKKHPAENRPTDQRATVPTAPHDEQQRKSAEAPPQRATVPAVPKLPPASEPHSFVSAVKGMIASAVAVTKPPREPKRWKASPVDLSMFEQLEKGAIR